MSDQDTTNGVDGQWGDDEDWNFEPLEQTAILPIQGGGSVPATSPTPTIQGTPLPAHVDDDVVEAVEDAPAVWFGIQFQRIPPELKQDAWIGLRRWVDCFVVQHNMSKEVRPCWFEHPDVVNELYATMCAEYKVWEEGAPGVGPFLSFHTYLPGLRQRLVESTQKFCSATEHKWEQPEPMKYDEARWSHVRDTVQTTKTIPRDESATVSVRVTTDEGNKTSNVVKVGAVTTPHLVAPTLEVLERAAPDEVSVSATCHRKDPVSWQISAGNDWVDVEPEIEDDVS
ncbi:hypothetical protein [Glutamicibacter uratoxydans]|uniref:hypothetical protein n=1 Tax=Glutamicibacter uratoxydans TaxID=43667 RepID=UPI003D6DC787